MTNIAIKDFKNLNSYFELIEDVIMRNLWEMLYKPMFKMLDIKAENNISVLVDSLRRGDIFYHQNGFKAVRKFSNAVSRELIRLGAKYDKYSKTFVISFDNLPDNIVKAIQTNVERSQRALTQINDFISDIEYNLDYIIENMVFNTEIKTILDDVQGQVHNNVKHLNIIEPELSEKQLDEIATSYTDNMQYYIKGWAEERIPLMREQVQKAILSGFREDEVQKMLIKEYNVGKNKAKFLAHNETSILLAEYKKVTYKEMGFEYFLWKVVLDGRERPEHEVLNNTVWRFDDPPTVITEDGRITKGLPGAIDYNCRCSLIPLRKNIMFKKEFEISEKNKRKYEKLMKENKQINNL